MKKTKNYLMATAFGGVGILLMNFFSSCCLEPLRKKFTRQKKKDAATQEFIPVLDPIDYPPKFYSAESKYQHHYSLWQVWSKDFVTVLESEGESDKRQQYLLNQMTIQLQEMMKYVKDEKRQVLESLLVELSGIQKQLNSPAPLRSMARMKSKTKVVTDRVRRELSPKLEAMKN